jgi:hypothetical protein
MFQHGEPPSLSVVSTEGWHRVWHTVKDLTTSKALRGFGDQAVPAHSRCRQPKGDPQRLPPSQALRVEFDARGREAASCFGRVGEPIEMSVYLVKRPEVE